MDWNTASIYGLLQLQGLGNQFSQQRRQRRQQDEKAQWGCTQCIQNSTNCNPMCMIAVGLFHILTGALIVAVRFLVQELQTVTPLSVTVYILGLICLGLGLILFLGGVGMSIKTLCKRVRTRRASRQQVVDPNQFQLAILSDLTTAHLTHLCNSSLAEASQLPAVIQHHQSVAPVLTNPPSYDEITRERQTPMRDGSEQRGTDSNSVENEPPPPSYFQAVDLEDENGGTQVPELPPPYEVLVVDECHC
ncbi:uncharacterized protein LOC106177792 isoform X1 [Lingula anatina]|uniref:Uncharacterized protein LOC106177792 isoform X1 n=1 Tax=Lingula anatina TaxID=7574 RepID=A0A1S3K0I5_LINAN|nr:uncharacterized protein LOC106177792 isoform X1 [Lingula anatina]|eukprot:XP_013416142.1 uncharacterized protein LOC106177792 isoform X1 [Lingula anatina]